MEDMNNIISKKYVFISYAREDYVLAKRLYSDLKNVGLNPWLDKEKIMVGHNWKTEIDQAIRESSYFCALLSKNSVTKVGYVQKELKKALDILDNYPGSEIFLLPIRLEDCRPVDERLQDLHWADFFPSYEGGLKECLRVLAPDHLDDNRSDGRFEQPDEKKDRKNQAKRKPLKKYDNKQNHQQERAKYELRSEPVKASTDEFKIKFKLDSNQRPIGNIKNEYKDNGDGTITDHATGLIWQKSGSENEMFYNKAKKYIKELNKEQYAGYSDWRLPTIEELKSLFEPEKSDDLYIDPIFDSKQWCCWSADTKSVWSRVAWGADYLYGVITWNELSGSEYVRAVRTR